MKRGRSTSSRVRVMHGVRVRRAGIGQQWRRAKHWQSRQSGRIDDALNVCEGAIVVVRLLEREGDG